MLKKYFFFTIILTLTAYSTMPCSDMSSSIFSPDLFAYFHLDAVPNKPYECVLAELKMLKAKQPNASHIVLDPATCPFLSACLIKPTQRLFEQAQAAMGTITLMVKAEDMEYDLQVHKGVVNDITIDENFVLLFFKNPACLPGLFTLIAHEISHIKNDLDISSKLDEYRADTSSVYLHKKPTLFIHALKLWAFACNLFDSLKNFYANYRNLDKKLINRIDHITQTVTYTVYESTSYFSPFINDQLDRFLGSVIIYAVQQLPSNPHKIDDETIAEKLSSIFTHMAQSKNLFHDLEEDKNFREIFASCQESTTHPSLYERIENIELLNI